MVPSPGPRPKKPPCCEGLQGAVDLAVVAGGGIEEAIDARLDVRESEVCADDGSEAQRNDGGSIDQRLAGDEKERAPYEAQEQRLSDIGLHDQKRCDECVETDSEPQARHLRPFSRFCQKPGRDDDERGLQEFGRLHRVAADRQPATGAIDLAAGHVDDDKPGDRDEQHTKRDAARLTCGQERKHDEDQRAQRREEDVALDEVVRRQALLEGHRRAGGQRENKAGADQDEDCDQQHMIDGEPPACQPAAVFTGETHDPVRRAISSATSRRKCSPRSSKFLYWS